MQKRILFTLLFLAAAGWLIAGDLPFLRLALDWNNSRQIQGQVTRKFSRSVSLARGGIKRHYFIEVADPLRQCSGTSRIAETDYQTINIYDEIPLRRLNRLCLATIDIHMYTPPLLQFISAGIAFLTATSESSRPPCLSIGSWNFPEFSVGWLTVGSGSTYTSIMGKTGTSLWRNVPVSLANYICRRSHKGPLSRRSKTAHTFLASRTA